MTPALHQYRVHCAGLQYITWARSACEAILSAIDLHGVPAASARRLPGAPGHCTNPHPCPNPKKPRPPGRWAGGRARSSASPWAWPPPCCLGGCDDAPHMR